MRSLILLLIVKLRKNWSYTDPFMVSLVFGWEGNWFFLFLVVMFIMKEGFILLAVMGRVVVLVAVSLRVPEVE